MGWLGDRLVLGQSPRKSGCILNIALLVCGAALIGLTLWMWHNLNWVSLGVW